MNADTATRRLVLVPRCLERSATLGLHTAGLWPLSLLSRIAPDVIDSWAGLNHAAERTIK